MAEKTLCVLFRPENQTYLHRLSLLERKALLILSAQMLHSWVSMTLAITGGQSAVTPLTGNVQQSKVPSLHVQSRQRGSTEGPFKLYHRKE